MPVSEFLGPHSHYCPIHQRLFYCQNILRCAEPSTLICFDVHDRELLKDWLTHVTVVDTHQTE